MTTLPVRFWKLVEKSGAVPSNRPDLGPCWEWKGSKTRSGYGKWNPRKGRSQVTHRATFEEKFGKVREGFELDHLCRTRHCCNPKHLEMVTHTTNVRRGLHVNSMKKACKIGHAFTPENTYVWKRGGSSNRTYRVCKTCYSAKKRGG